jgi:hypothetical protein
MKVPLSSCVCTELDIVDLPNLVDWWALPNCPLNLVVNCSQWKKILVLYGRKTIGEYSILLLNWAYAFQTKPYANLCMKRRSSKIDAKLHTMKKQACTNNSCLSSLLLLKIFCFNQQFYLFFFKLLQLFWPYPCWTWISAWASTQSTYLSCVWSSLNKKFVFVSRTK